MILDQTLIPRTIIKEISLYFNELTQNEGNPFIFEVNLGYPRIFYLVFFFKKSAILPKKYWYRQIFFILMFSKKYEIAEIFWRPLKNLFQKLYRRSNFSTWWRIFSLPKSLILVSQTSNILKLQNELKIWLRALTKELWAF